MTTPVFQQKLLFSFDLTVKIEKKNRKRLSVGKFWKGFIVLTKTFEEGGLWREIKEIE
jgi:hypothetical protein